MKFPVMGIEEPAREKEKKVQMLHTVDTQKKKYYFLRSNRTRFSKNIKTTNINNFIVFSLETCMIYVYICMKNHLQNLINFEDFKKTF